MRYFLLFLGLLCSQQVFSADYYWTRSGDTQTHYASAWSACPPTIAGVHFVGGIGPLTSLKVQNATNYVCTYSGPYDPSYGLPSGTIATYSGSTVTRFGDSCPVGATYNTVTGSCDSPPEDKCAAKKGKTANFVFNSNTDMPPQTVPVDGCMGTVTKAKCSYISAGKAVCNGTVEYSGVSGTPTSIGDASECADGVCPDKSLDPEKQSQDCVYITNGNGVSTCSAQNYESNPGKAQCGDVNGAYTCIENPKANSTKSTLASTKTSTSNSDGTVTIVKDNTVTTITCSGKTCTSVVTTSKGTTTTNSSGQVTGNNSSCSGKDCSATGEATPSTGSGSGNGAGNGDGEGEEGDGDSPSAGTLTDPVNGSFDGQENEWDSKINEAKTKFQDAIGKLKDTFKPMGDVSLNGGSKLYCPPPVEVLGKSFDICIDKYADSLSWISDAILALCAMVALVIVFA